jgi:alpha-methylacyl-CoA racemase
MGPLAGFKVIEIAGIGPAPFCGMMLADMGADVIVVHRKSANPNGAGAADPAVMGKFAIFNRGKRSIMLDLKKPAETEVVLKLVEKADALIEGFRPGVIERLGLGPEICLERNPALIFGRMTGWGQHGPLAQTAGHDINYIALSGALYYSGHGCEAPFAPPTLVGDLGGGAMILALGVLAGILNARQTNKGQVIDAAVSDGSALLNTLLLSFHQMGSWSNNRSDNIIDSGSPWYDTYECADGHYITVGSLEPQFYELLLDKCELSKDPDFSNQFNKADWPNAKEKMAALFKKRTRAEWCDLMEGTDVCFAPVLNFEEAATHPHNRERETFLEIDGVLQPAPAPRFSETPSQLKSPPPLPGADTDEILRELGYENDQINE